MSWFWMALSAAALWGLGYAINQITLKHFSVLELLFFESVIVSLVFFIYFAWFGNWSSFIHKLANPKLLTLILLSSFIYIAASFLILSSISASNAGLAAIIESCYPIFTMIFSYLIFRDVQFNFTSAIGVVLIICGIIIVKLYGHAP